MRRLPVSLEPTNLSDRMGNRGALENAKVGATAPTRLAHQRDPGGKAHQLSRRQITQ